MIKYLMENQLLHIGMIEVINRNSAEIFYSEDDGVLLKEKISGAYMLSVESFDKGKSLIDELNEGNLFLLHQEFMTDYIIKKFNLAHKLECFQASYMSKNKLKVKSELEIRHLNINQKEVILENYNKLSEEEIDILLNTESLFGGYKEENLVGFIGNHLEGSIGLLEIFTPYRRLGYGETLECCMVNHMLEQGRVPFGHIEIDNDKSIALQKKLGFTLSEDKLYWLFWYDIFNYNFDLWKGQQLAYIALNNKEIPSEEWDNSLPYLLINIKRTMINDKDKFKEVFKETEASRLMFKISDDFEDKESISKLQELLNNY